MMRIIAGSKRGMKLLSPKTAASRPITDRVKESLFSVLFKYDLPTRSTSSGQGGKLVADLFCGVGSLGLEALSRGAEFVTFVEQDPKVVAILNRNIEKAGFVKESKVIRANAFKIGAPVEKKIENRKSKIEISMYDLVFVDPPYASTKNVQVDSPLGKLLYLLNEQVAPDCVIVVRTNRSSFLLEQYGRLQVIERRQWGTMAITILRGQIRDK